MAKFLYPLEVHLVLVLPKQLFVSHLPVNISFSIVLIVSCQPQKHRDICKHGGK